MGLPKRMTSVQLAHVIDATFCREGVHSLCHSVSAQIHYNNSFQWYISSRKMWSPKGELVVLACGSCMSVSINLSLFNTLFLLLSLLIAFMFHVHSGLLYFVHADLSSLLWFFTILRIFLRMQLWLWMICFLCFRNSNLIMVLF